MKRLTLVRHAKSSWSDPPLPDNERPLTSRGQRDASTMATRLAARGERPDLILTSHAVRAKHTARALAAGLRLPEEIVRVDRRLYLATAELILEILQSQDDRHTHVLAVGHNPGMTEIANTLVPSLAQADLPTAAVVTIEVQADRWAALAPAACRLLDYDWPKKPAA